jgi:hypothetical protein
MKKSIFAVVAITGVIACAAYAKCYASIQERGASTCISSTGSPNHEIHYVGAEAQSSWVLKSGTCPTAPRRKYDGSYLQD